jgi:tetratricopeptide (TPR) repeat protein
LNKTKQALRNFKRAIKEDEELDEAYLEMAAIEITNGKIQEALHYLNKALTLDPDNPDYLFTAVQVYDKADMKLEMIKTYKKIIALGFDDDEVFMDYAEVLIELDEVDDALTILEEGVTKHPESDDIHLMMAGYLLAITEYEKAFEHIKKANNIDAEAFEKFAEYFPELVEEPSTKMVIQQFKALL